MCVTSSQHVAYYIISTQHNAACAENEPRNVNTNRLDVVIKTVRVTVPIESGLLLSSVHRSHNVCNDVIVGVIITLQAKYVSGDVT